MKQRFHTSRLVVVAALIFDAATQRMLVTRRMPDDPPELAGRYEFPGGKVEAGEEPRVALAREIREELGIDVEVGRIIETLYSAGRGRDIVILCYQCRVISGEPQALEVAEWRWQPIADLDALDFIPLDRPFVKSIADAARAGQFPLGKDTQMPGRFPGVVS
jgi:mutator protein MutT